MVRINAIVHGHVQGVGFRYWTHHTVQRLDGVTGGFVRNRPDGTVEVEAEAGDRATLQSLFQELHRGPAASQVTAVDAGWEDDIDPRHAGFTIR